MPSDGRLVTATMLRDLVVCERRPWLDVHGDAELRAPVVPFVELLWSGGMAHETAVLERLGGEIVDLRRVAPAERSAATLRALAGSADHILGGELRHADLLGRPDLLSRHGGAWFAGDVKAGSALMPDGRRPRMEYAAQVGLYAHMAGLMGIGEASRAFVIGADGEAVWYDLDAPDRGGTLAERVALLLARARSIVDGREATRGAAGALCGLCHWRAECAAELEAADDPTLIAGLGRSLRTLIEPLATTRRELAALDVASLRAERGGRAAPGLGTDRLERFRDRAVVGDAEVADQVATEPTGGDPVEAVELVDHDDGAGLPACGMLPRDRVTDEARQRGGSGGRDRQSGWTGVVFPGVEKVEVEADRVNRLALHLRVDREAATHAHRRTGQTVAESAETGAIVLPVGTAPHHGEPQHVGAHSVAVVDNGDLVGLAAVLSVWISQHEVDPLGIGLDRVVDQFGDRLDVALVSDVPDAPHERFRHDQSKFRAGRRSAAILPLACEDLVQSCPHAGDSLR